MSRYTVTFSNPGAIDPRSIATFGVSAKENPGAIGFFGTGLKYAIAVILRYGGRVEIWSAGTRYNFGVAPTTIRGAAFNIVTMNGEPLGFTTELGKTWEMWQAFRELWCNCADEGGTSSAGAPAGEVLTSQAFPATHVIADCEAFYDAWADRDAVILSRPALHTSASASIHPGASSHVFYRGIRALRLEKPSLFTYNVLSRQDLTEDRTLKYSYLANTAIARAVVECAVPSVVRTIVTAPGHSAEAGMSLDGHLPSEPFLDILSGLMRQGVPGLSPQVRKLLRTWRMNSLLEIRSGSLSTEDEERLRRAVAFCTKLGFPVADYPIIIDEWLDENILGKAEEEKIHLSPRVFMMGTKMVAGTLLEEYIHLKHGLCDETRALQNYLIDLVCSLGERVTKETL